MAGDLRRIIGDEEDNCGICGKKVREHQNGMGCDLCDVWYQCGCVKITEEEYKKMKEVGDKIFWFCKCCKEEEINAKCENMELRREMKYLNMKITC